VVEGRQVEQCEVRGGSVRTRACEDVDGHTSSWPWCIERHAHRPQEGGGRGYSPGPAREDVDAVDAPLERRSRGPHLGSRRRTPLTPLRGPRDASDVTTAPADAPRPPVTSAGGTPLLCGSGGQAPLWQRQLYCCPGRGSKGAWTPVLKNWIGQRRSRRTALETAGRGEGGGGGERGERREGEARAWPSGPALWVCRGCTRDERAEVEAAVEKQCALRARGRAEEGLASVTPAAGHCGGHELAERVRQGLPTRECARRQQPNDLWLSLKPVLLWASLRAEVL